MKKTFKLARRIVTSKWFLLGPPILLIVAYRRRVFSKAPTGWLAERDMQPVLLHYRAYNRSPRPSGYSEMSSDARVAS